MKNPNELTLNTNNINKRIDELLYKIHHTASNVDLLQAELESLICKVPTTPVLKKMPTTQEAIRVFQKILHKKENLMIARSFRMLTF